MDNNNPKLTPSQFAQKVKSKYPQYQNIKDDELVSKMIEKYPSYKDQIDFTVKKKDTASVSSDGVSKSTKTNSPITQVSNVLEAGFSEQSKKPKQTTNTRTVPTANTKNWGQSLSGSLGNAPSVFEEYQQSKSLTADDVASVKQDLDNEINNKGLLNNITNLAKDWWNGVFSQEQALQVEKNPLATHFETIKRQHGADVSPEQITKMAYDMELEKRSASLSESKERNYLTKAQKDGKLEAIKQAQIKVYDERSQQYNNVVLKDGALKIGLEEQAEQLVSLKNDIEKTDPNSDGYNEKVAQFQALQQQYQKTFTDYEANNSQLQSLGSEVSDFEHNLDMLKRDYGYWSNFTHRIGNALGDTGQGLVTLAVEAPLDYAIGQINLQGKEAPELLQTAKSGLRRGRDNYELSKEQRQAKHAKEMSIDDVHSLADFGAYTLNLAASQSYNLVAASTGPLGIATIGMGATGQKRADMLGEMERGEEDYNVLQQVGVPLLSGGAEAVGGYVDRLMLNRVASTVKAASSSERKLIAESMAKKFTTDYIKSTGQEVAEETTVQVFQNILDKYALGKNDVNVLDGVKDAAAGALVLTSTIQAGGGLTSIGLNSLRPFSYDKKITKLNDQILKFETQLSNPNIDEATKTIITEQIEKLYDQTSEVVKNRINDIESLSNEQFQEILSLEKQQAELRAKANEIKRSSLDNESKAEVLKGLEQDFKTNDQRRVALLKRGASIQLERLPEEEQIRLKDEASRELIKELDPDGTQNIELDDNQISKRALQNYRNEQKQTEEATPKKEETFVENDEGFTETDYNPQEDLDFLESLDTDERAEVQTELDNSPRIQDVIDSPTQYTYNGEAGHIRMDGQQVVFETPTTIHELGNVNDISDAKLLEYGIEPVQELDIQVADDYSVAIEGNTYTNTNANPNDAITVSKNGEYSVTLENENGQRRTIRGQRAEQIAYNYKLKELENATEQRIDQARENSGSETETGQTAVSQTDGNTEQRPKKRRRKQRSLKQHKAPLTKAQREEAELNRLIEEEEQAKVKQANEVVTPANQENDLQPRQITIPDPEPVEVSYKGSTYFVTEKRDGTKEVRSKKGKVIEPTIKRRSDGKVTDMINPNYAKIIALHEGKSTTNQDDIARRKVLGNAVEFLNQSKEIANVVLAAFANGARVSRDSYNKEVARGEAKGIHWTNNGVKERDLPSIDMLAHEIWMDHYGINSDVTDSDIRNEIIELLSSYDSRTKVENDAIDIYLDGDLNAINEVDKNSTFYRELVERQDQRELDNFLNTSSKEVVDDYNQTMERIQTQKDLEQDLGKLTDEQLQQYYYDNIETNLYAAPREVQQQFYAEEGQRTGEQNRQAVSQTETNNSQIDSRETQEKAGIDLATDEQLETSFQERNFFDKLIDTLEKYERGIDKFGRENLSMGLPLVLAKGAIKVMKATALTTKKADEIVRAGLDYIKQSDWYKNLTDTDKKKINLANFKQLVAESVREINRTEKQVQEVQKKAEKQIAKVEKKAEKQIENLVDEISNLRQRLVDNKIAAKTASNLIKDFLKANKITGKVTPSEINRLVMYANKIATAKDKVKAFDDFVNAFEKINKKAQDRLIKLSDRQRVEKRIEKELKKGKTEQEIVSLFRDNSTDRKIAEDYFERTKHRTDEEIRSKMDRLMDNHYSEKYKKNPFTKQLSKAYETVVQAFFDRAFSVKKAMNKAGMNFTTSLMIATKGAPGYANYIYNKAHKEIFAGLTTEQNDNLNLIIRLRRIIAIEKDGSEKGKDPMVHTMQFNLQQAEQALRVLENDLGSNEFESLQERANKFFKQQQDLLTDLYKNNIITEEFYNEMKDVEYIKTRYLDFLTDADQKTFELQKGASTTTGIESMKSGWDGTVELNANELLAKSIQTAVKAIATNKLNTSLVSEYTKNKNKVELLRQKTNRTDAEQKTIDDFENIENKIIIPNTVSERAPKDYTKITYYENGEQKTFFMENAFYNMYSDNVGSLWESGNVKNIVQTASGVKLVKTIATGQNPTFFITNTPRDFFWILNTSMQYSNNILIGGYQLTKDFFKGSFDVKRDSVKYQRAVEYGLMMDFLHLQGRVQFNLNPRSIAGKALKFLGENKGAKAISYLWEQGMVLGKYSEIGFRMAVFNRTTDNLLNEFNKANNTNYKSVENIDQNLYPNAKEHIYTEAVVEARLSTVDFNQGGHLAKDIEAVIPYFNAAAQGTRMLVEKVAENPIQTTLRFTQTAGLISGMGVGLSMMILQSLKDDDEDVIDAYNKFYSGVSKFDRANYIVIPIGKKDGEYEYTRIAMPQALTPFFAVTRGITHDVINNYHGKKAKSFTYEDTQFALDKNLIPIEMGVSDNAAKVPILKAALSYTTGYDFFREQDISIKRGKVDPRAEGFESKSVEGFYKELGREFEMSPARMKVATESMITTPSTNVGVGVAYGALNMFLSKEKGDKDFSELALKSFGGRIVKNTSDFNRKVSNTGAFKDKKYEKDVYNTTLEYEAGVEVRRYYEGEVKKSEAVKSIREIFGDDQRRIKNYIGRLDKNYTKFSNNAQEIKFAATDNKALLLKEHFGDNLFKQDNLSEKQKELKKELVRMKALTTSVKRAYLLEIKK